MAKTSVLVFVVLASASAQESIRDRQAIAAAQQTNVQQLDRSLRAKQAFSVWFAELVGSTTKVVWEVNDCGEATGSAADRDRDLPMCAEARAFLGKDREVVISIMVGTTRKGIVPSPGVYYVIVEERGSIRDAKTLSGLAQLLRK